MPARRSWRTRPARLTTHATQREVSRWCRRTRPCGTETDGRTGTNMAHDAPGGKSLVPSLAVLALDRTLSHDVSAQKHVGHSVEHSAGTHSRYPEHTAGRVAPPPFLPCSSRNCRRTPRCHKGDVDGMVQRGTRDAGGSLGAPGASSASCKCTPWRGRTTLEWEI